MLRKMSSLLLYIAVALLLLNGAMYLQQPAMIFFPVAGVAQTPAEWGMAYEDVYLTASDQVRLHGWYIPPGAGTAGNAPGAGKVLLFFHGNAGNISQRRDSIEIFHRLGLGVFILDYRGYGQSQGSPDEQGLYRDARAAWGYLTQERGIERRDIIVFGRSLGGAVATQLAAEVQPEALIVESVFSSARDMAKRIFPLLSRLMVMRYRFDVARQMRQVKGRILVAHSPEDEIIPFELGEKVYQAAGSRGRFLTLRGDHNSGFLLSQPEYENALRAFISAR